MERTIEAMAARIRKWEMRAGESFTDYYMHDKVKNVSWAFWLLGKGFNDRANELIDLIQSGERCIDQEMLYELYGDSYNGGIWTEETHMQNVELWAEFLIASDRYWNEIVQWFKEN